MSESLIGRTAELDAVARFLAALERGSAALIVDGAPGSGLTTLAGAFGEAADAAGVRVLRWEAAPAAAADPRPFAALGALLAEVEPASLRALPAPQRDALGVVVAGRAGSAVDAAAADARAVATATLGVLGGLARERAVALVLDGAERLDRESALVLEFCARRLPTGAGLLLTRRLGGSDSSEGCALAALRGSDHAERHLLAPLTTDELERLLRARLRRPGLFEPAPARAELRRICESAAGNPGHALALALAAALHPAPPALAPAAASPTPHAPAAASPTPHAPAAAAPTPHAPAAAAPAALPPRLAAQLAALDASEAEALLAVVAVARPTLSLLRRLRGADATGLVERLEAHGLVELRGELLVPAHPLLAGAVAAGDDGRRRALHRRLATLVDDAEERARQLAHAALPQALPALDAAADEAAARGAPARAAELLELALARRDSPLLRLRAARLHFVAGDPARAEALLLGALPELGSGRARADALLLLAELRSHDDSHPRARTLLEQARGEAGDDRRLVAVIDLRLAVVLANLGLVSAAVAPAAAARSAAEALGDDTLLARALALETALAFALGHGLDEPRLRRALALEEAGALDLHPPQRRDAPEPTGASRARPQPRASAEPTGVGASEPWSTDAAGGFELRPSLLAAQLLLWSGRLDEAAALVERVAARDERRGAVHELAWTAFTRAAIACWRGDLDAAAAATDDARERLRALGTSDAQALALTAAAQLAARAGRADDACADAAEALRLFTHSGWRTAAWRPLWTLGNVALSRGDTTAAAAWLAAPTLAALDAGLADPLPWGGALSHGDAVEALVGCGRLVEARRIAAVLERRGAGAETRGAGGEGRGASAEGCGSRSDGRGAGAARRWPRGVALRARGLLLAAGGDLAAAEDCLQAALEAHAPLPLPLERARGLLLLGRVQRRRRRAAARDSLERAVALFEELGAPLWAAQAHAELARLAPAERAPDALTDAERRVVDLVVTGMTNREVAAALFLSPKTVETHLARVYRKLGIGSRAELGARLAAR